MFRKKLIPLKAQNHAKNTMRDHDHTKYLGLQTDVDFETLLLADVLHDMGFNFLHHIYYTCDWQNRSTGDSKYEIILGNTKKNGFGNHNAFSSQLFDS